LATLEITKRQKLTNSVVKKRAGKKKAAEDKEIASLQEELRAVTKKGKARKIKRSRTPAAPRHQTAPFDWAEANDGQLVQLAFIPADDDDNETLEQAEKRREDINKRFKEFKIRRAAAKAEQQEASIDLTDDGNGDTEEEAPRKKKRKSRKN
jgi:hypothetical protein